MLSVTSLILTAVIPVQSSKEIRMKIEILGCTASGKTTTARKLSRKYGIPAFNKDYVIWKPGAVMKEKWPEDLRETILDEMLEHDGWIIEGAMRDTNILKKSFPLADFMLYLDIPTHILLLNATKRWVKRMRGDTDHLYPRSVISLHKDYKNILRYIFRRDRKLNEMRAYGEKFKMFSSPEQLIKFVEEEYPIK